ncbi:nucleoside hydrolase-like domain-containing protein [Dickeya solani]|nr:nucleoside hydrolase-like domain-containing protein [Dickeya solani]ANE76744.1 hypothetical protein A4U42_16210 [Dickeya solani IPO 2222]AUC44418.1 hypothetical protein D083_4070 [Dickeya solani RNS 08.23.3.1.A]AYQ47263.1 hypothetical protein CTB91_01447 [Dickeya solani]AYQ51435.1 hypothetical protein DSOL99_01453 [Dickeya solani]MBD3605847.1 hypothetical protein [Dickeya solani]
MGNNNKHDAVGRFLLAVPLLLGGLNPATALADATLQSMAGKTVPWQDRPRVFVLSDIGNEPDDQMSLTRFLLYSNELNIEGMVATTSTWQKKTVRPDMMARVLSHYAEVQPNLLKHDARYPAAASLKALIASGQSAYGMGDVGPGKASTGAVLLLNAIERSTDGNRPLYINLWGGANTLAQALTDLSRKYPADKVNALTRNLIVYAISDQDDAGYWVRQHYPEITYIVDPSSQNGEDYARATWTGISGDKYYRNAPGADFSTVSQSWLDDNIRKKGPLGKGYLRYDFIMEGDTPAFLGLIRNGLASEMNPGWGGWGGRYILRVPQNETRPIWSSGGDFFPGSPNAADTVIGMDGRQYTSNQATIWRWRTAFQHDFAARMDWSIKDYAQANHNPVVVVNGSQGKQPISVKAKVGETIKLSAAGSRDPDGDTLSYQWIFYPEASSAVSTPVNIGDVRGTRGEDYLTYPAVLSLSNADRITAEVKINHPGTAHIILAVTDSGTPALTSYRRVMVVAE